MSDTGAIYGSMLLYFPELFQPYTVFTMKALSGGKGYGPRENVQAIEAVVQFSPGGELSIQADNRQDGGSALIWIDESDEGKVEQGTFIDLPGKGIFIFKKDDTFMNEGGFSRFSLVAVKGPTDQQKTNVRVDLGISDYA